MRKRLANYIPTMMRLGFCTEVLPNPNNRVTLSNKLDEYGVPCPKIHFEVDQYVYNALKKGHEIIVSLLSQIKGIKITEPEWKREYRTAAHIMGTCRMGNDPRKSVVKYGRSRIYHEAFTQAEGKAQAENLIIWNPATNGNGSTRDYQAFRQGVEEVGGRGYAYVSGNVEQYRNTPQIVLTNYQQISDLPPE